MMVLETGSVSFSIGMKESWIKGVLVVVGFVGSTSTTCRSGLLRGEERFFIIMIVEADAGDDDDSGIVRVQPSCIVVVVVVLFGSSSSCVSGAESVVVFMVAIPLLEVLVAGMLELDENSGVLLIRR
jgi:hypothetical protein